MGYKDKQKQREYCRLWMSKRREEFFKDKFCQLCGSTESLELHHLNPKEKENHRIWSWSEKRRNEELKKCVVWCERCHIKYHSEKQKKPITHGISGGYARGCRCNLCRGYHIKRMKRYHKNKKELICQHSSISRTVDL